MSDDRTPEERLAELESLARGVIGKPPPGTIEREVDDARVQLGIPSCVPLGSAIRELQDRIADLNGGWDVRARLARAAGMWMGGLDGPPPSIDDIEKWIAAAATLRHEVHLLRDLRWRIQRIDSGTYADGVDSLPGLLTTVRQLLKCVDKRLPEPGGQHHG